MHASNEKLAAAGTAQIENTASKDVTKAVCCSDAYFYQSRSLNREGNRHVDWMNQSVVTGQRGALFSSKTLAQTLDLHSGD